MGRAHSVRTQVHDLSSSAFGAVGFFIGKWPIAFVLVPFLFSAILCAGFANFFAQANPELLWAPSGSQSSRDRSITESVVGLIDRHLEFYVEAGRGRTFYDPEVLGDLSKVVDYIWTVKSDANVTFSALCVHTIHGSITAPVIDCDMVSVLDFFGHGASPATEARTAWTIGLSSDTIFHTIVNGTMDRVGRPLGPSTVLSADGTVARIVASSMNRRDVGSSGEVSDDFVAGAWEMFVDSDIRARSLAGEFGTVRVRPVVPRHSVLSAEYSLTNDPTLLVVGGCILIVYLMLVFARPHAVFSHVLLAFASLFMVAMVAAAAIGIVSSPGVDSNPVVEFLIVLITGVCVNHTLVLMEAWRVNSAVDEDPTADPADAVARLAARTLADAGSSIFATSLCDVVAFAVATHTVLPGLRDFCIFACIGFLLAFLYSISWFLGWMCIDEWRVQAAYRDVLLCLGPVDTPDVAPPAKAPDNTFVVVSRSAVGDAHSLPLEEAAVPSEAVDQNSFVATASSGYVPSQVTSRDVNWETSRRGSFASRTWSSSAAARAAWVHVPCVPFAFHDIPFSPQAPRPVGRFLGGPFSTIVTSKAFIFIALLLTTAAVGTIGVWGAVNLEQKFSEEWLVDDDASIRDGWRLRDEFFANTSGISARVTFVNGPEEDFLAMAEKDIYCAIPEPTESSLFAQVESQITFADVARRLQESEHTTDATVTFWYKDFLAWVRARNESAVGDVTYEGGLIAVVDPVLFDFLVAEWAESDYKSSQHRDDVRFVGRDERAACRGTDRASVPLWPSKLMMAASARFSYLGAYDTASGVARMEGVRELFSDGAMRGLVFAFPQLLFEGGRVMIRELVRITAISVAVIFVVVLALMADVTAAVLISLCVAVVDVILVGLIWHIGGSVHYITIVCVVMSMSLTVDYLGHVMRTFLHTHGGTRRERVRATLSRMGGPVWNGAFASFIAIIPLAFSENFTLDTFCIFYTVTVGLGAWMALCLLPAMLVLVGPDALPPSSRDAAHPRGSTRTVGSVAASSGGGSFGSRRPRLPSTADRRIAPAEPELQPLPAAAAGCPAVAEMDHAWKASPSPLAHDPSPVLVPAGALYSTRGSPTEPAVPPSPIARNDAALAPAVRLDASGASFAGRMEYNIAEPALDGSMSGPPPLPPVAGLALGYPTEPLYPHADARGVVTDLN